MLHDTSKYKLFWGVVPCAYQPATLCDYPNQCVKKKLSLR